MSVFYSFVVLEMAVKKAQSRRLWVYVVLVLLLVVFVGGSLVPLVGLWRNGSGNIPAQVTPSPTPNAVPVVDNDLAAEARGYELVLEREPDNVTALRGLVEVRVEQGDLDGAIAPLERLATLVPEQPDYLLLLGQTRQYFGDLAGALQAYETALDNHPGYIKALQSMVALQLQQDRPEWAIGLLQTTLKTAAQANAAQPNSIDVASVQMLLGRVYEQQERLTEALAVYDQVIAKDAEDFRPVWAKAEIFNVQGRTEDAQALYGLALSLAPPRYKDPIKRSAAAIAEQAPADADSSVGETPNLDEGNPDGDRAD
jgi:tetratricopeptide (TPR) repeat protein